MIELNLDQYTTQELIDRMIELNTKCSYVPNAAVRQQMVRVITAYQREIAKREG